MDDLLAAVIGFGNPGRGDDGIGPALIGRLEELALPGVQLEADYQLAPEHAASMADASLVVLVDASVSGEAPFSFTPVEPAFGVSFSTHGLSPSELLGLAETLAGRAVRTYLLAVRGWDFEPFAQTLSPGARENLRRALLFLIPLLKNRSAWQTPGAPATPPTE